MPRLTTIYTRKGDQGHTQLGGGQVVTKDDIRIATLGDLDELNALLGVLRTMTLPPPLDSHIARIQNELFDLGAEICFQPADLDQIRIPQLQQKHVQWLENTINDVAPDVGTLDNFILPGGIQTAAHLHWARTVCRRAERNLVRLYHLEGGRELPLRYINRLSDALFMWARWANWTAHTSDVLWRPGGETPAP